MGKVTTRDTDATDAPAHQEELGAWLSAAEIARIDALVPRFSTPSQRATRADVLRRVVLQGVEAEERRTTS